MKIGLGQLVCLIAGVTFLSFGTGLLSGRMGSQKPQIAPAAAPQPASLSFPSTHDTVDENVDVTGIPQPPPIEEKADEKKVTTRRPAGELPVMPVVKEPTAPVLPRMEQSAAPLQMAPAAAPMKEANRPVSALGRKYVVQVLSTPSRTDAAAARNKIMGVGFPAGIFEADLGEKGTWYRIYVGPYDNEFEAEAALTSVQELSGFASSFVKPLD